MSRKWLVYKLSYWKYHSRRRSGSIGYRILYIAVCLSIQTDSVLVKLFDGFMSTLEKIFMSIIDF